jgi:hypothetical protein
LTRAAGSRVRRAGLAAADSSNAQRAAALLDATGGLMSAGLLTAMRRTAVVRDSGFAAHA